MSTEVFSEAMGLIGEKYIMEAATYQRKKHAAPKVWLSKVAGVILAILLAGSAVLAFSTEARAAFFGWIRQQVDSLYGYFFVGDPVYSDPVRYELMEIPEGFTFAEQFEIAGGESFIYTNSNGKIGEFSYSTNPDGLYMFIDAAECEYRNVTINGMSGDLYISPEAGAVNTLVWTDDQRGLFFSVSFPVDGDALFEIAESIETKD